MTKLNTRTVLTVTHDPATNLFTLDWPDATEPGADIRVTTPYDGFCLDLAFKAYSVLVCTPDDGAASECLEDLQGELVEPHNRDAMVWIAGNDARNLDMDTLSQAIAEMEV